MDTYLDKLTFQSPKTLQAVCVSYIFIPINNGMRYQLYEFDKGLGKKVTRALHSVSSEVEKHITSYRLNKLIARKHFCDEKSVKRDDILSII